MNKIFNLVKRSKTGLESLQMAKAYVDSALHWIERWLTEQQFSEYVPQIEYLIDSEQWELLLDSFYQVIPFGTGGRRGTVGIGPNRINPWTIRSSAQGHSQYLVEQLGQEAKSSGVVLTYDVRKYSEKGIYNDSIHNPVMGLDARDLALAAARVYAANGIRVYFFEGVRSTPELSFAIRHLNAAAGDMFSASHNPPSDNGKKIYDRFGGQLIAPHDQILVDEVTGNVSEIHSISIREAESRGLITYVGEEIDAAFLKAVENVSLSGERNLRIVYSPLNGTGLTSIYPVLKNAGFDVLLDSKTDFFSGAFENITFNIPNPEVEQSFDTAVDQADAADADIILNSDPDADRIGIMVRHQNDWCFLNGNEIGILLTEYGLSKLASKKELAASNVVIKTDVTTSLIGQISKQYGVRCIDDLLVGFKYIADELNKLEKKNQAEHFILGAEESHGILVGNYCRDKDAAGAALWLAELAAELKRKNKTLVAFLDEIYARYGYCHNYLTEIRLLGARGVEQIQKIMDHLRSNEIAAFGKFKTRKKIDRWQGPPQPHLSQTDTSSRNVLVYYFENIPETRSIRVTVRPSGTEPKIKMYFEVLGKPREISEIDEEKKSITAIRQRLEKDFMGFCYQILDVDFPARGYLLFWQLPLNQKLEYFRIEPKIAALREEPDRNLRGEKLENMLRFLGSNPVEKVNRAFKEKYGMDLKHYLEL